MISYKLSFLSFIFSSLRFVMVGFFVFASLQTKAELGTSDVKFMAPTELSHFTELKSWTLDEIAIVQGLLKQLENLPLGPHFLAKITKEQKDLKFFRKTFGGERILAWAWFNSNEIVIYDLFFKKDEFKLFNGQLYGLIHEISHIFNYLPSFKADSPCLSCSEEFRKIAQVHFPKKNELTEKNHGSLLPLNYSPSGHLDIVERTKNLSRADRIQERNNYARGLGFPSFYSFTDEDELFAELVSTIITSQEGLPYLNPELVSWLTRKILED